MDIASSTQNSPGRTFTIVSAFARSWSVYCSRPLFFICLCLLGTLPELRVLFLRLPPGPINSGVQILSASIDYVARIGAIVVAVSWIMAGKKPTIRGVVGESARHIPLYLCVQLVLLAMRMVNQFMHEQPLLNAVFGGQGQPIQGFLLLVVSLYLSFLHLQLYVILPVGMLEKAGPRTTLSRTAALTKGNRLRLLFTGLVGVGSYGAILYGCNRLAGGQQTATLLRFAVNGLVAPLFRILLPVIYYALLDAKRIRSAEE